MGWEVGGTFETEETYVYLWLIHVAIWQKPTQYCKAIILMWLLSCSVMTNSLWPDGLQHTRPPYPSLSPGVCSNSCPLSQWCHPTISYSVIPFSSCLQSFPASGSFPMSQAFSLGGQSIGASASVSVLPMNIQGWFHLGLIGLITLQSKGLSRVFSAPQFEGINSSACSLFYCPALTIIHDYWKNHSFDYMDIFQQNNVTTF